MLPERTIVSLKGQLSKVVQSYDLSHYPTKHVTFMHDILHDPKYILHYMWSIYFNTSPLFLTILSVTLQTIKKSFKTIIESIQITLFV